MPFDHGLYAGPKLLVIPNLLTNSSIFMFLNSVPLSAYYLITGIPKRKFQYSFIALTIVSAFLLVSNFP